MRLLGPGRESSFNRKNQTISDKQAEDLRRRGSKANQWFTKESVDRTKKQEQQRGKSRWS